jgi:hypothetical protein
VSLRPCNTLSGGIGSEQNLNVRIVPERFLSFEVFFAAHATVDDDNNILLPKLR